MNLVLLPAQICVIIQLGVQQAENHPARKRSSNLERRRRGRHVAGHRPLHEDSRDVKVPSSRRAGSHRLVHTIGIPATSLPA
jgi:hypothetical protein